MEVFKREGKSLQEMQEDTVKSLKLDKLSYSQLLISLVRYYRLWMLEEEKEQKREYYLIYTRYRTEIIKTGTNMRKLNKEIKLLLDKFIDLECLVQ